MLLAGSPELRIARGQGLLTGESAVERGSRRDAGVYGSNERTRAGHLGSRRPDGMCMAVYTSARATDSCNFAHVRQR